MENLSTNVLNATNLFWLIKNWSHMWFLTNIQEFLLFVKSVTRLLPKTPSKITKLLCMEKCICNVNIAPKDFPWNTILTITLKIDISSHTNVIFVKKVLDQNGCWKNIRMLHIWVWNPMFVICATKDLENWTNWIDTNNFIIQKVGKFQCLSRFKFL